MLCTFSETSIFSFFTLEFIPQRKAELTKIFEVENGYQSKSTPAQRQQWCWNHTCLLSSLSISEKV